jgi:hypothetical protein
MSIADEIPKVAVNLFPSNEEVSSIENDLVEISRAELANQNIPEDYPAKWELLFAVREIDKNSIAIAITILQLMPDEIIEAGSKHQIFYAYFEKDKSANGAEQNQNIREYITSEFLSYYKQPIESKVLISQKDKIKETCSTIIKEFVEKHF